MSWDVQSHYFSGQGVVLMGDMDANGFPTGLLPVGNIATLTLNIGTSVLEHKETQTGQRGTDKRMTTETSCGVSMGMESWDASNLSVALRATSAKFASGSVVGEANKVYLGKIMPLKFAKVSSVIIKEGATTLVAYTAGMDVGDWDYILNAEAGSIKWADTPASALVDGDDVTVDYTRAAQSVVQPLVNSGTEKFLRFEGLNTADELKPVIVEIFRFVADPLKTLDLINNEIAKFPLEASALMDSRRPAGESKFFRKIIVD